MGLSLKISNTNKYTKFYIEQKGGRTRHFFLLFYFSTGAIGRKHTLQEEIMCPPQEEEEE